MNTEWQIYIIYSMLTIHCDSALSLLYVLAFSCLHVVLQTYCFSYIYIIVVPGGAIAVSVCLYGLVQWYGGIKGVCC